MTAKIRDILNPLILNNEWVGFNGDSEYLNDKGELILGYWVFLDIIEEDTGDILTLDSEIDEFALFNVEVFKIRNDHGNICLVEFRY